MIKISISIFIQIDRYDSKCKLIILGRRPRHTILIGYKIRSTHSLQPNLADFVANFIGTNGSSGFYHLIKLLSLKLISKIKKNTAGYVYYKGVYTTFLQNWFFDLSTPDGS